MQLYAVIDITSAWVQKLQQLHLFFILFGHVLLNLMLIAMTFAQHYSWQEVINQLLLVIPLFISITLALSYCHAHKNAQQDLPNKGPDAEIWGHHFFFS